MATIKEPVHAKRILVVDDDLEAALLLSLSLRRLGHTVVTANNAEDGLAWAEGVSPEVVLLDLEMEGMDGYQTCRTLRTMDRGKNALIVAVTGHGEDEDRRRTKEAGFDHHLVKPVDRYLLDRLIEQGGKEEA